MSNYYTFWYWQGGIIIVTWVNWENEKKLRTKTKHLFVDSSFICAHTHTTQMRILLWAASTNGVLPILLIPIFWHILLWNQGIRIEACQHMRMEFCEVFSLHQFTFLHLTSILHFSSEWEREHTYTHRCSTTYVVEKSCVEMQAAAMMSSWQKLC